VQSVAWGDERWVNSGVFLRGAVGSGLELIAQFPQSLANFLAVEVAIAIGVEPVEVVLQSAPGFFLRKFAIAVRIEPTERTTGGVLFRSTPGSPLGRLATRRF
jgi:hypothetical protein